MSKKSKLIEQANKRLLNEDLPPTIHFSEHEVLNMMCELIDYNMSGKEEMPEKLVKVFQEGLKSKGRSLETPNTPPGAMM
tara:strand:- start:40004 stop:40243 length:240 start_codon:yes stop_codon:yes gene_type:complete